MPCRLVLVAAEIILAAGGCADSGGTGVERSPIVAMMPCTTDEDCRAHPFYDAYASWAFPPLCIFGMCQGIHTHHCSVDADCADVYNGSPEPDCIEWPPPAGGSGVLVCRYLAPGGPVACPEDGCLAAECVACCYPTNDPDPRKYTCVDRMCEPLGFRVEDPNWCDPPEDRFSIGGCHIGFP